MSYNHLSAEERGQIEAYLKEGVSQAEIARRLDRHRSTISREIKRGSEQRKKKSLASLPYQATSAGNLARIRKKNCGTTTKATVHNTKTIMKYLDMKYSPEQIANAVRSVKVCTSWRTDQKRFSYERSSVIGKQIPLCPSKVLQRV